MNSYAEDHRLVIVNPAAGGGLCGREAPAALEQLTDVGLDLDIVTTAEAGEATELAREGLQDGVRRFIAVGGDGTGFEVVNGLLSSENGVGEVPRVGFLPLGTGNSFLRDFHDRGTAGALEALARGRGRRCDAIRLTHDDGVIHFINNCIIGFAADVGALRNRRFAGIGQLGYILSVILQTARLSPRPLPFSLDEGPVDREPLTFLTLANSRFTGGKMMMAPDADPSDGQLDVIRAGSMSRPALLATFPKIFKGTHLENPAVSAHRARRVDLELPGKVAVLVDGELLRLKPRRLEVLPGALEVEV